MVFGLKKCGVVEYGATVFNPDREWDLQGGKILEVKVQYNYLSNLFHQSVSRKTHCALDLVKRVKRRMGQLKHTTLSVGLSLTTASKVQQRFPL
jgi:hypothetical protein